MLLGFKTELKVNNYQRSRLAQHCGVARHSWNWALGLTKEILEHNKANPDSKIKFPSKFDLCRWLVALVKSEHPWYYKVSKCVPQYSMLQLSTAWKRAFKKNSKPPRFKRKGRHDSFSVDGKIALESRRVKLPMIGWIKTYERLPTNQKPNVFTISRHGDRWFVSWNIETEPTNYPKAIPVVGVDLGIKTLATLSTGETFQGAKSYRKYEKKLARLQRVTRNKIKGSANIKKAYVQVARLHAKIANIRQDTLHKLTTYLAKNHSKIVIEDLNVSGMMANRKLAKAIADMGFYTFRHQLDYKCKLYGSELVVADRWFASSKTCSGCGVKKSLLTLADRVFSCPECYLEIDRDLNAAINLRKTVG